MARETQLTSGAFWFAIAFYVWKRNFDDFVTSNIFQIATYLLIITSTIYIFAYINQLKLLYNWLVGSVAFSSTYLGVLLAGTRGLSNSSADVVEGLTRIVLAVFAVWHLSSSMRNLTLEIDPTKEERSTLGELFYGILFPPKEFFRLLKVIVFILLSFYLISSGLHLLGSSDVNINFFAQTERLSLNILFFGIQTPMMMASRASVSKTFSEYIKNLDWAESAFYEGRQLSQSYRDVLNANEISYDSINSNGKHLWLTVLLVIILQAFEESLLQLDLFTYNWNGLLSGLLHVILENIN